MNHLMVYENVIINAKSKNRKKHKKNDKGYIYYENHHILPKCLDGLDEKENLVLLTAREHYICHKLLTYIYPENFKIIYAFFKMTRNRKYSIFSSKDYEYTKMLNSNAKTGINNPMYGKTTSKLQKESVRRAHLEGRIKLTEAGRRKIIETNKKRRGKKNKIKKSHSKKYELISPKGNNFIIFGAVDLQKFCMENKLQFHVIKNNFDIISKDMVVGNKIFAKNTIGWKRI